MKHPYLLTILSIFNIAFTVTFTVALAVTLVATSKAYADIAVRDESMSENEFRAQTMALGHTTFSDWITNENLRWVSPETLETFRARLVEAQTEWLKRTTETSVTPAIDRLLGLRLEADWSTVERDAFKIFFGRKFEIMSRDEKTQDEMKSFALESSNAEDKQNNRSPEWSSSEELRRSLPSDIAAVMINGQVFDRLSLATAVLPRRPLRVTLVSNSYQPVTIIVADVAKPVTVPFRIKWVDSNCQIASRSNFVSEETQLKVLSTRTCAATARLPTELEATDEFRSKFGIQKSPPTTPSNPDEPQSSILKRPWFWGALGLVAIGAVVAYQRGQNQENVRPIAREGW